MTKNLPHANTLIAERNAHLANISALEHRAPKLSGEAAARALRTIDNLHQQAQMIDDLLSRHNERAA